jgi:hypothetical protein
MFRQGNPAFLGLGVIAISRILTYPQQKLSLHLSDRKTKKKINKNVFKSDFLMPVLFPINGTLQKKYYKTTTKKLIKKNV